jgi:hypothetical protein
MPSEAREIIRVLIASPGDVQKEREHVCTTIEELNKGIAGNNNLVFDPIMWETDSYPGFHDDGPQGKVDQGLQIEDCHIFICIFWKRFGTPVRDADSGTEHEFKIALSSFNEKGTPQIMLYFNQKKIDDYDKGQFKRVLEFRDRYKDDCLHSRYNGEREFEKLVRQHLTLYITEGREKAKKEHYLKGLINKYASEKIFNISITLGQLYVEPKAEVFRNEQSEEKGNAEELIKKYLQNEKALIIESPYGMGKTSILKKLAYDVAEEWKQDMDNNPFPIFIELKTYDNQGLLEFVEQETKLNIDSANKYMFFLDGFDELCILGVDDEKDRAKEFLSVRKLKNWFEKFPESTFIISTRPNNRLRESSYEYHKKHPYITLQEFDDILQNSWIDKWNSHWEKNDKAMVLDKENPNISKVKKLLGTPLFLFIAMATKKKWGFIVKVSGPECETQSFKVDKNLSRSDLYKHFLDFTIEGKYMGKHNLWKELFSNDVDCVEFLQDFAYFIFTSEKGSVTSDELKKHFLNTKYKGVVEELSIKRFKDVFVCFFFQHGDEKKSFTFAHPSMMEFLVARYYKENPAKEVELLSHLTDPNWQEVFLFYCELLDSEKAETFLEKISNETKELINGQENIINLLKWAGEKAKSLKTELKTENIRFYYINLAIVRALVLCDPNCAQTRDPARPLYFALNDQFLEHSDDLELDRHLAIQLPIARALNPQDYLVRSLALIIAFAKRLNNNTLLRELKYLQKNMPYWI